MALLALRGKLFEFFVEKILLTCGFYPVRKDNLLVYEGSAGTMVQGLGQPHNADVLVSPPIQTPFYFPTRLIVECKCYDNPVGLPIIRNALGMREDINHFDIVTEEILENRKSSRTTCIKSFPIKRYNYQVAVASYNGFKNTAFPFAQAHRIPLISFFQSHLFDPIHEYMIKIEEEAEKDEVFKNKIITFLRDNREQVFYSQLPNLSNNYFDLFYEELIRLQGKMAVGLLEDGTIIFLVKETEEYEVLHSVEYTDGCSIHWADQASAWKLKSNKEVYYFELPREIYNQWISYVGSERQAALRIKQQFFSKIVIFHNQHQNIDSIDGKNIEIIKLSDTFMREAERHLHADE